MAQRTCDAEGCERPHLARGWCALHYKRVTGCRTRYTRTCVTCGAEWQASRPDAKYCSDACKGDSYRVKAVCSLPPKHEVRRLIRAARAQAVRQPRECECEWCGAPFVTHKQAQRMCSSECKVRAKVVRRRGRQYGWATGYTWTEVMHLFIRFDRRCAYCDDLVVGQPDPDHVVPLSKGGSNSITNILPACRLCNSDKRDLLLDEWAADRARRSLPPVRTSWPASDLRYLHLTSVTPAA